MMAETQTLRRNATESIAPVALNTKGKPKKKDVIVCFTMELFDELIESGATHLSTRKDRKNPDENVFIFEKTPEAQRVLFNYIKKQKAAKRKIKKSNPVASAEIENCGHA